MSQRSDDVLIVANPLSVGLLNADSAFLLDEKYYLDESDQNSEGLIRLVEELKAISREEITTGVLNLFFKSHRKGIRYSTRETILVVLPTLRNFSKSIQNLTSSLLFETEKRNNIINQQIKPLKIGEANIQQCLDFQKNLLSQLSQILEVYRNIYKELRLLSQLSEDQESVIMYAFFHLKKDSYQTELEDDIVNIEQDFQRSFLILGKINGFIERLKKRIIELENKIIPDTKNIEITGMDDF